MADARVLLMGLDGADWRVLSPLIDAGDMPVLQGIVEGGSSGRLLAAEPIGSAAAWATLLTGRGAHVHGVLSDVVPAHDGRILRPVEARDRAAPTMWEIAAAEGMPWVAIGWGEPFGAGLPGLAAEGVPAPLAAVVSSAPPEDADLAALIEEGLRAGASTVDTAVDAMRSGAWRIAAVRFPAFGALVANFIRFVPPCEPGVLAARAARYAGVVREVCRAHDSWLGELVAAAGPGTSVFVVSERGIELSVWRHPPGSSRAASTGGAAPGIVAMRGPGFGSDAIVFGTRSTDVAAMVLGTLGIRMPEAPVAAAFPDGRVPEGASDAVASVAAMRQSAFAAAAAACGDRSLAVEARTRIHAARPEEVANTAVLAGLLVERGDAAGALAAIEACRAAVLALGGGASGDARVIPWQLALAEARVLVALDRCEDAAASIDRAASAAAPQLDVLLARASLAESEERYADSERHARAAIDAGPSSREARMALARALFAQGCFAGAVDAAREALGMAWADPVAHLLLGTALAASGRAREAIAALEDCLRVHPEFPPALRRLAAVHMNQLGDVEAARRLMARAVVAGRSGPSPRRPLP
ncbi:MAG: alkaline phosphatase family protein [Planctomycetota bacterium]